MVQPKAASKAASKADQDAMTAQTPAQRQQKVKAAKREAGLVRLEAYVTKDEREKYKAIGANVWLRKKINAAKLKE